MVSRSEPQEPSIIPCTWQPEAGCRDCAAAGRLMCRFVWADLFVFAGLMLPFFAAAITGVVRAGLGGFLWGWLAYAMFFFFGWEAYILCRHCPFWAEADRTLHCHANYGVVKFFKYTRQPMSKSERVQFIIGALLLFAYPFPFLLASGQYVLALVSLVLVVAGSVGLVRIVCPRCIHFSCPLNRVPKPLVDLYLQRNPPILEAWKECGYVLGEGKE